MHHGACTWYDGILTRCSLSWSLGSTRTTPICTVHTQLNWPVQHLYGQRDADGGVESTVIYAGAAMERIQEARSDPSGACRR